MLYYIYILSQCLKDRFKKGEKMKIRKRMQFTHSSSSGSSLGDKDPTSLSSLPPMVARACHGLNLQEGTERGSPSMYFMKTSLAGQRRRSEGTKGSWTAWVLSFNHPFSKGSTKPTVTPTTKKGVAWEKLVAGVYSLPRNSRTQPVKHSSVFSRQPRKPLWKCRDVHLYLLI